MDTLGKLFSSPSLVKIMRLFLFNPETAYDKDDIKDAAKVPEKSVLYETKLLSEVGFLKSRTFYKEVTVGKGKNKKTKKKKVKGWVLNANFKHLVPLRMLLINKDLMSRGEIRQKLQKAGKLRLIALSGIFMDDMGGSVDLIVVGDKLNLKSVPAAVRSLESVIGSELRYAAFPTDEFKYRLSIRDRLLRDVFESTYSIVHNTLKNVELPGQSANEELLLGEV